MSGKSSLLEAPEDFSLVLGGPLYQLYLRARLVKPPLELLYRRIVGVSLFAWLPLVPLALLAGDFWGGVKVPFIFDLDAHARILGSLPLLIAAEVIGHKRIRTCVRQFVEGGLIAAPDLPRFEAAIASAMRLRNSVILELAFVAAAFSGHWFWKEQMILLEPTWYAHRIAGAVQFTPAGWWYAMVSLPLLRFLTLRWYFRLFVWYCFLWQTARMPLRLNPLHPDRAGGLGFLAGSLRAFAPVLVAHTVLLSGWIANRIWHSGATLPQFKLEIAGILVFLLLLASAPTLFFCLPMARAKRVALREYGLLAGRYVAAFREKWIVGPPPEGEALLGSADIQSLADLAGGYDVVREMRMTPFSKQNLLHVGLITALPLAPLVLTVIPLEEMIDRAVGVFI